MKRVLRILAIAAIIFAAMQLGIWVNKAMAQNVQLQWTAATTNCDLTVADDVAGYVIEAALDARDSKILDSAIAKILDTTP